MGAALELNQALSDLIESDWPLAEAACPLEMPGDATVIDKSGDWGRVSFLSDDAPAYVSAGPGSAERYFETVQAEFFTLAAKGRHRAAELADKWASLWRHHATTGAPPIAGYTFQPTRVIPITGPQIEGGRLKTDCLTAFERDFLP